MPFKNIIFEITEKKLNDIVNDNNIAQLKDPTTTKLESFVEYRRNPEGRVINNYEISQVESDFKDGDTKKSYKIKTAVNGKLSLAAYDNLVLHLLYNDVKLNNIKFYVPKNEVGNIWKFLVSKENQANGKDIFYLKHSTENEKSEGKEDEYTAKIAAHKKPSHEEILRLTSFMRQYL